MDVKLHKSVLKSGEVIKVPGSKSETNRLLILKAQFPEIYLINPSNSDDSVSMDAALKSHENRINIGHAGTTMRFLTAWFASQENRTVILDGSKRMRERPIGILVDALRQLGAKIEYLENESFPPIKISGTKISETNVVLDADISSQYISALLLISPTLANGIQIELRGQITSRPYIEMTLALLSDVGMPTSFAGNRISVGRRPTSSKEVEFEIESDWSSASYYYSIIALSPLGTHISLQSFKTNSRQGDRVLESVYRKFGVTTTFGRNSIELTKSELHDDFCEFDLTGSPDIAQTVAVTCVGLGADCNLTGLHTLKIKETDRLIALQNELTKFGATVSVSDDSLSVKSPADLKHNVVVETYGDHRMAMAFAPLALKVPLQVRDSAVVSKSYRSYWEHLSQIGFKLETLA
ncbi:MAG: 3-phosphoshikimate 1-carboxyvinyltransferase [Flavobacterium sp.]|nr:3-phosphoshikimate 1-carboxyvinyltransferase [Flavobacterium sp.]